MDESVKIEELEKKKSEIIGELKRINSRLRYKAYEQKALELYLKEHEHLRAFPLKRRIEEIEFRIATEAYTPKLEKKFIREIKKVEEKLSAAIEIERRRKKQKYIAEDLVKLKEEKNALESKLLLIRRELKNLREKRRKKLKARVAKERIQPYMKPLEKLSLGDVAIIEKKKS